MIEFVIVYLLPVSLTMLSMRGSWDLDDSGYALLVFIPGVSLLGYVSLLDIIIRRVRK